MSIGRSGMWPVDGPGVLDVHAFMYFDGRALFLQSADPSSPAKMNGRPIGANWQQVEIPCTIEMGRARLVYRVLDEADDVVELEEDEQDRTIAAPIRVTPATPNPPAGGFGAGAFSNRHQPDDESTRFAPIQREPEPTLISPLEAQQRQQPAPVAAKPRPAAGAPAPALTSTSPQAWSPFDGVPPSSTTVGPAPAPPPPTGYQDMGSVQIAMPPPPQPQMPAGGGYGAYGAPPGLQGQAGAGQMPGMQETGRLVPPTELKGFARAKAEWQAMPLIRKVIFASTPVAAVCAYVLLTEEEPPPPRRQRPVPSASASASTNPATSVSVATAVPTATNPPTATTVATVVPTVTTTAPTTTTTAPPPTATGSGKKPVLSLERQAADALRAGKRDQAAQLYDQLATQHPENPAYKEAARILRAAR